MALPGEDHLWAALMYLGRYGHQSVDVLCEFSSRDLARMVHALSEHLVAEGRSDGGFREARASGGG